MGNLFCRAPELIRRIQPFPILISRNMERGSYSRPVMYIPPMEPFPAAGRRLRKSIWGRDTEVQRVGKEWHMALYEAVKEMF